MSEYLLLTLFVRAVHHLIGKVLCEFLSESKIGKFIEFVGVIEIMGSDSKALIFAGIMKSRVFGIIRAFEGSRAQCSRLANLSSLIYKQFRIFVHSLHGIHNS
jgi:hypothetical protein